MFIRLMLISILAIAFIPTARAEQLVSQQAKAYKINWCTFVAKSVSSARINALTGKPRTEALKEMRGEKPGLSDSSEGAVLIDNMVTFAYTRGGYDEAGAACMDEDPNLMPKSVKDQIRKIEKKVRQQLSSR